MSGLLSFTIGLEDRLSPGAKAAVGSLRQLSTELSASKSKLSGYQQQLSQAKELGDIDGYRKYSKLVAEARREVFTLGDAFTSASQHAGPVVTQLARVGGAAKSSSSALGSLALGLGVMVPSFASLVSSVKRGAEEIVEGFVRIGEEAVATALRVGEVNERLRATFEALGAGPGSGQRTLDFLNELSTQLPQSRDQLAKWATQYEALGITDLSELRNQIRATAAAQAIAGDEGAEAYKNMAERIRLAVEEHKGLKLGERTLKGLYQAGVNVTDVANRMGISTKELANELKKGTADATKFGAAIQASLLEKGKKPLDAMGNSIEVLERKGHEVFDHLFDGLDTSPITDGIKSLIALGDQGNPSGKALHDGIVGGLQGVIDFMGKVEHGAKILFLQIELYAVTHKPALDLVTFAFKSMATSIGVAADAIDRLFSYSDPPAWMKQGAGAVMGVGAAITGAVTPSPAPAHAEGGLVKRPAAGEFFASVAPGEMILPTRAAREISGSGLGPSGRGAVSAAGAGSSSSHTVTVGQVVVQAAAGVTDAQQLSVTGLALALERYQLGSGR